MSDNKVDNGPWEVLNGTAVITMDKKGFTHLEHKPGQPPLKSMNIGE